LLHQVYSRISDHLLDPLGLDAQASALRLHGLCGVLL
jgi:hypothetical protein